MTSKSILSKAHTFEINVLNPSGGVEKIVFQEIAAEERKDWAYLGTAIGLDLGHCFFMGFRHDEDFLKHVAAYHLSEEPNPTLDELLKKQPGSVQVAFYGRRPT